MSFLGQAGFFWGIGVCEDRFDPEKLGRIRVRWLGIHDEDKEKILTKDLPWSTVMQPATAVAATGIGTSGTSILEGSWVVGFAKDPEDLQEWIVMGILPGDNTTTAVQGTDNPTSGHRKWAKYRGNLKEYSRDNILGGEGRDGRTVAPIESDLANKFVDYEKGFHDPTMDLRNIPWPPSDAGYGNPVWNHAYTPPTDAPGDIILNDPDKKINRVMNHSDAGGGDHPNLVDLDPFDEKLWDYDWKPKKPFVRVTHSDILHYLYQTTRRIKADKRFLPAWTDFGTFRWRDCNTYFVDDLDYMPELTIEERKFWGSHGNREDGREGVIFSTGYLEPDYWSEDREYGKLGGTYGPAFPVTRDTPTVSKDPAGLTKIGETDTRAGWGKAEGDETGYWSMKGEDYRVPNPRVRWVMKVHLSHTERQTIMELFKAGHYGTGIYNISKPGDGRKDIQWKDVKEEDLVVVPQPDINPLALGGIPIEFTDGVVVKTKSSLWADSTTYFNDPNLCKGEPAKPLLQEGDIVQIAGVRGMQEINGRIFRLGTCSDDGTSFTMELWTADGTVWSGPAGIEWEPEGNNLGKWAVIGAKVLPDPPFSEYLGGGVVIPHNPHRYLCWKADMRERQINIGSPDPETGVNEKHWNQPTGDYNARYPFNNVYESESGHIMEYDDTPGAERISQFHRSGTNYEIDHNGNKQTYVKGDNYDIRLHDDYMYVKGKVVHTYDDEVMIRCNDRADISANWGIQMWSGGDLDIHSKRNINLKSDGDINLQADGHINLSGTTTTHKVADEYRAGSRNKGEFSKIKMKAGHLFGEIIGDIERPREYGIFLQSAEGPIGIKTLHDGDWGNIHIASGWDMELFSWRHQYRTAGKISNPSNIYDYAIDNIFIEAEANNIEITVPAGYLHASILKEIHWKSCTGNIVLHALDNTIDLVALFDVNIESLANGIDIRAATDVQIFAVAAQVDITGGTDVNIWAEANELNLKAALAVHMQSVGDEVHIKSEDSTFINAAGGSVQINSFINTMIRSGLNFHNYAEGKIYETAEEIHMNGPEAAQALEADPTPNAGYAGPARLADPSIESLKAWIPDTFELQCIDLPNPRPAVGWSVNSLALNKNDTSKGVGGENIRNLHDTIENLQKGLSAYATKTYPSTSGKKVYVEDQIKDKWTGGHTTDLQDPWNGINEHPWTIKPLGEERRVRYEPVAPPC